MCGKLTDIEIYRNALSSLVANQNILDARRMD